jgi:hypothetical protein
MDDSEKRDHSYYQGPEPMVHQEEKPHSPEDVVEEHVPHVSEEALAEEQHHHENDWHSLKTLVSWHAPGRPYHERGKEYYINVFLIALFLGVILLLFHQYLLMAVLASLVFLAYALSSVPPRALFYRISTEGVMVEDHFYIWEELYDFYFKHIDGHDVLHIRTKWFVPGELILVLGEVPKDHVRDVLLKYLPFREYVKPTFTEKSGDWLAKTFPLERR